MKKIFMLLAAAATIFAVSCNRAQAPEALIEEEDNSPVAVKFGSNLAAIQGVTKAAVDGFTGNETLYIYGIKGEWVEEQGEGGATTLVFVNDTDPDRFLINNVAADSPELDATAPADIPENMLKGAIEVWDPQYEPDLVPFFYGANGEVYNFYAYYVGDAIDDPTPDDDLKLAVPFDGTQDIMMATTDQNADYDAVVDATNGFSFKTVYSAKAARKNVHPNLIFKHQLSRFVFQLQFRPVDRVDEAQNITIQQITLATPSNEITMDIDDQEVEFTGEPDTFILCDENGEPYTEGEINTTDWTQAGESIMVAPGESIYHMTMSYDYMYNNIALQNLPPFEWDINLPLLMEEEGYKAEAGKKYIVKLVVYGPEEVKITVTLEDWDEIELPEIDPDAE